MYLISILTYLFFLFGSAYAQIKLSPEEALQKLKDGNQHFVEKKMECVIDFLEELKNSKKKQTPFAAILCCSDSRVPPEIIFNESLRKLFVVRVAGNVATDVTIGSLEYAILQLKVPLVIVLGHDQCRVLEAAVKKEKSLPPFIEELIQDTSSAVEEAEKESKNFAKELHIAIVKNVQFQIQEIIEKSVTLSEAKEKHQILLQGAVFHFKNGRVEWCPCL